MEQARIQNMHSAGDAPEDPSRLHLHHGPIDLIVGVWGDRMECQMALEAAATRFKAILDELISELPLLRARFDPGHEIRMPVARRMADAVAPLDAHGFITPMAAVAGAVADEVLCAMLRATALPKAFVNNGGDIAVHTAEDSSMRVGLVGRPDGPEALVQGYADIDQTSGVGGIATSGRHGRSFSLGIADAVTVLAKNAAAADAAATIIANHVDTDSRFIERTPARLLDPDSDLGDRLVVTALNGLDKVEIKSAIDRGAGFAQKLLAAGYIVGAHLKLDDETRTIGAGASLISDKTGILEHVA